MSKETEEQKAERQRQVHALATKLRDGLLDDGITVDEVEGLGTPAVISPIVGGVVADFHITMPNGDVFCISISKSTWG